FRSCSRRDACRGSGWRSPRKTPRRGVLRTQALATWRSLTVKLRGRTTTPDERRGRTLSPGARGAEPPTPHGPLQRLLDSMLQLLLELSQCTSVLWQPSFTKLPAEAYC